MKELIQLLQIWKDQGAIKPDGLLKDADIQKLIDKMAIESQESDLLPCVSDFAKSLLNQGDDLYERAKQARSEKEEGLLAVESLTYKRIGKELMAHCC